MPPGRLQVRGRKEMQYVCLSSPPRLTGVHGSPPPLPAQGGASFKYVRRIFRILDPPPYPQIHTITFTELNYYVTFFCHTPLLPLSTNVLNGNPIDDERT